jgi:type II secretory pathway pseudopilin PulG
MRPRRGFTLVEVLLAVLLIDIGLLALVGTSAVLVRQSNALRLRNSALRAANNRVQQLGGGLCAATLGVNVTPDGVREEWSADPLTDGFLDLRDSVSFLIGTAAHAVVLRTRVPC